MADAFGTGGGVVAAVDHRLAQAGLIAPQSSSIAVRTGVLYAPGAAALVTGTSATGTMTVSVAAHHWVTTRGTADGVYIGCLAAATTVNIAAAPGANSRIDVVYVKQNDAGSTISPDGSTGDIYAVVQGTAAVSPTKPAIPVGALELATVTVAVGATATNGAGVTIANTAPLTTGRGAPVPVRNQTERDALTTSPGLHVTRIDAQGALERWVTGTTWRRYPANADVTIGDAYLAAQTVIGTGYTDLAVVTGTSSGGVCVARFNETSYNGNSGADRTMDLQVTVDGVAIGSMGGILLPLADVQPVSRHLAYLSTPSAGVHTWRLQARASAGAAALCQSALLTVVEKT